MVLLRSDKGNHENARRASPTTAADIVQELEAHVRSQGLIEFGAILLRSELRSVAIGYPR